MTLQDAAKLLKEMAGLWPNFRPDDPTVAARVWATVLADVELAQASAAVFVIGRRNREFAPSAGLVLDVIREMTGQRYPTPDEALAEVDTEIRRVGFAVGRPPLFVGGQFVEPERPVFSCEPVARAVAAVTWRALCLADDEQQTVIRSQFLKQYAAIAERAATHAAALPLGTAWQIEVSPAPALTGGAQ